MGHWGPADWPKLFLLAVRKATRGNAGITLQMQSVETIRKFLGPNERTSLWFFGCIFVSMIKTSSFIVQMHLKFKSINDKIDKTPNVS